MRGNETMSIKTNAASSASATKTMSFLQTILDPTDFNSSVYDKWKSVRSVSIKEQICLQIARIIFARHAFGLGLSIMWQSVHFVCRKSMP